MWEANTSVTLLNTGADVVVLRHPAAVPLVKHAIDEAHGRSSDGIGEQAISRPRKGERPWH